MSSSSDIEKLFEQFGGDANAYQEIGRENDARIARTRWPLLVTLDLTQPAIPEIGQLREAKPQAPESAALTAESQDTTPKDVASVTRAKAPLFMRSHRRDIPPVAAAPGKPAMPSGASSRFGVLDAAGDDARAAPDAGRTDAPAQGDGAAVAAPIPPAAPAW
ncbi:cellulose biosynthesis protein BcsP, partial [Paraburkholderia sp.]|uniref:cellulose biosynthesis protein BcsP n=1 Tax=Paraburkholderia sp. TaxID=1926495 RepID=UPI0039E72ABE